MTSQAVPDSGSIRTSGILPSVLGPLCAGWIPALFGIAASPA